MKRKYLWLPMQGSSGECYHATRCGAHSLEKVPYEDAVDFIEAHNLEPCGNCMSHHGLEPINNE